MTFKWATGRKVSGSSLGDGGGLFAAISRGFKCVARIIDPSNNTITRLRSAESFLLGRGGGFNIRLRKEMIRLQKNTGVTLLYVTHNPDEAAEMATRVIAMKRGRIEKYSTRAG